MRVPGACVHAFRYKQCSQNNNSITMCVCLTEPAISQRSCVFPIYMDSVEEHAELLSGISHKTQ